MFTVSMLEPTSIKKRRIIVKVEHLAWIYSEISPLLYISVSEKDMHQMIFKQFHHSRRLHFTANDVFYYFTLTEARRCGRLRGESVICGTRSGWLEENLWLSYLTWENWLSYNKFLLTRFIIDYIVWIFAITVTNSQVTLRDNRSSVTPPYKNTNKKHND